MKEEFSETLIFKGSIYSYETVLMRGGFLIKND